MSMETSGGNYYDSDEGGFMAVVRRNLNNMSAEVRSGDAGGRAAGVAAGVIVVGALMRARDFL